MMAITRKEITSGLRELGLRPGYRVLVHTSLSSFGQVEGGANTLIDALLDAVGDSGTVIVPTLTGSEELSAANPPVFHVENTPCWTGRVPETFRQRPDAIRSLHPTHSTAAIGADADALLYDHIDSMTPCDENSPYGKLAQLDNGYVLLLGVGHISNTTFHHVEEIVGVDYHLQSGMVEARIESEGAILMQHIFIHAYGVPRNFGIMEQPFLERGVQRLGQIGNARIRLVHAGGMVDVTARALRADRTILCAKTV
jgi:aminoglycoside 3-N-acetyltransferase